MARVAIIAAGAHALLFLALHLLEPGLSPSTSIISDYARTDHGAVATAAFIAFGTVWGALAFALSRMGWGGAIGAGRMLFVLAMAAILVAAVFPATADPRTGSVLARVQNVVARPGLFLGVLLVSLGLRRAEGWEAVGSTLVGLAVAAVTLLIATVGLLLEAGWGGVGQRVLFLVLYAWVWLVARRILRDSRRAGTPPG